MDPLVQTTETTKYPSFPLNLNKQKGCCGGNKKQDAQSVTPSASNSLFFCACKNQYQPNADCEFQQFLENYVPVPNNINNNPHDSPIASSNGSSNGNILLSNNDVVTSNNYNELSDFLNPTDHTKANTSCLLCKIRHRKCDYHLSVCNHCAKEHRSFCIYINNVKRGPKRQSKKNSESSEDLQNLSPETIDLIYRTIYNNINNIRSEEEIIVKLSFDLFKKIVNYLIPISSQEDIYERMKISLQASTTPFIGDLDYFKRYFHKIGEKEVAFMSILQAICLQRLNEKKLAHKCYERARGKLSFVFDHVSDFELITIYCYVSIYLIGEGERQLADYYLNHVKFYVKEFQPQSYEAQFLLCTILQTEIILQENDENLLKHLEQILILFSKDAPLNNNNPNLQDTLTQATVKYVSNYVTTSNKKMFVKGTCRMPEIDSNVHRQLKILFATQDKQQQQLSYQLNQLEALGGCIPSITSNSFQFSLPLNSNVNNNQHNTLNQKITQINNAIQNIQNFYGKLDYNGNTFIMTLYGIVILTQWKIGSDDSLIESRRCADLITKCTEYDDFSISSYSVAVPVSLASKVHLFALRNVLMSNSMIIHEYAQQLFEYLSLDFEALDLMAKKYPIVQTKYANLIREISNALSSYIELSTNQPNRFIKLHNLSQPLM
ncbi:hypothetical protein ABK040_005496 [Willaertia magna]